MKSAAAEDSPHDADALREVLRASLVGLATVKKEVERVSLVGSRIAAGVFSQGTKEQRRLVCESTQVKSIKSSLEVCKPSLTHLFGDDESRIDKELEATKYYQGAHGLQPYRPKAPYFRSPDSQGGREGRSKPYSKKQKSTYRPRSLGKGPGPAPKKGEGQKK
jgi:hypothetical protein